MNMITWDLPQTTPEMPVEARKAHYLANHNTRLANGVKINPTPDTLDAILGANDLLSRIGGDPAHLIVEEGGYTEA